MLDIVHHRADLLGGEMQRGGELAELPDAVGHQGPAFFEGDLSVFHQIVGADSLQLRQLVLEQHPREGLLHLGLDHSILCPAWGVIGRARTGGCQPGKKDQGQQKTGGHGFGLITG
jgi:hypothetical protein